jgi:hypothetical protein
MKKQNFRLTVFLGDVFEYTSKQALQYDNTAFLLDFNNCEEFFNNSLTNDTTVYTSLGDLSKNLSQIWNILISSDEIVYCPPAKWSDNKTLNVTNPTDSIHGLTEHLLLTLPAHVKVTNFNRAGLVPDPVPLVDSRRGNSVQLWIAGCSFSHGLGVESQQRYGQLVANQLDLPVSFLTRDGSSISWAADQILRSDIKAGDIVIWGLTAIERLTYVQDNKLSVGVTVNTYKVNPKLEKTLPAETLTSQNTFYSHIYSIEQVVNFCKATKAKLLIIGLLTSDSCLRYLADKSFFHRYPYSRTFNNNSISEFNFVDTGTDNLHPGPEQHLLYKNFIISII